MNEELIAIGKKQMEKILKACGDVPISEPWEMRPNTGILRFMCDKAGVSYPTLAEYLNCSSVGSLRTKLSRGSCDVKDLVIAAHACDFDVCVKKRITGETYTIDFDSYVKSLSEEEQIKIAKQDKAELNRAAYEVELRELKKKYGY